MVYTKHVALTVAKSLNNDDDEWTYRVVWFCDSHANTQGKPAYKIEVSDEDGFFLGNLGEQT